MSTREHAQFSISVVWYFILVGGLLLVAGIVASFMVVMLKPAWLGFERQAYKSSHQYIEAKQSLLLKLVEEHETAAVEIARYEATLEDGVVELEDHSGTRKLIAGLRNQQEALVARMRRESKLIPDDEVPPEVKALLRNY